MHPAWARSLRDQCQAAGVPFFFKQWGEWAPDTGPLHASDPIMEGKVACAVWNGQGWDHYRDCYGPPTTTTDMEWMYRLGKKRAGRLLDGREWNEVQMKELNVAREKRREGRVRRSTGCRPFCGQRT